MVSPRKSPRKRPITAVFDQSCQGDRSHNKIRKTAKHQLLAKKKFYLDIKNLEAPPVKQLAKDLIFLGGTIEPFFSKEVTTVITEAPEWRLRPQNKEKLGLLAPSPSTSIGTARNNSPNNWSPLSVQEEGVQKQKFQAKSRVETILEKAKQQNASNASKCDVIESAQKLGITIWLLPKILNWISNKKEQLNLFNKSIAPKRNHPTSATSDLQQVEIRELKAPFIKFEDTNHEFRPVISEFRRFPKLFYGGRAGQSPFFAPELVKHKLREPSHHQHIRKKVEHHQQKVQQQQKVAQPQAGYCEICEAPFSELEEHLDSKVHTARVGLNHLWTKLDSCIKQVNHPDDSDDEDNEDLVHTSEYQ